MSRFFNSFLKYESKNQQCVYDENFTTDNTEKIDNNTIHTHDKLNKLQTPHKIANQLLEDFENRKLIEIVWHESVSNIDNLQMKHLLYLHVSRNAKTEEKIISIQDSLNTFYGCIYFWTTCYLSKRYKYLQHSDLRNISLYLSVNKSFYLELQEIVYCYIIQHRCLHELKQFKKTIELLLETCTTNHKKNDQIDSYFTSTTFHKFPNDFLSRSFSTTTFCRSFLYFVKVLQENQSNTNHLFLLLPIPTSTISLVKFSSSSTSSLLSFFRNVTALSYNRFDEIFSLRNISKVSFDLLHSIQILEHEQNNNTFYLLIPYICYDYSYRRLSEYIQEKKVSTVSLFNELHFCQYTTFLLNPFVTYFQHVYVINLERRLDRRKRFEHQTFQTLPFTIHFFKAIDPIYDTYWAMEYNKYNQQYVPTNVHETICKKLNETERQLEHQLEHQTEYKKEGRKYDLNWCIENDDYLLHYQLTQWNSTKRQYIQKKIETKSIMAKTNSIINHKRYHKRHLREGEYGIFQSTLQLFQLAIEKNMPYLVILEDDVCFHVEFQEQFQKNIINVPQNWNILSLGTLNYHRSIDFSKRSSSVRFLNTFMCGAHGTIYRLDAIKILYSFYQQHMYCPIDEILKLALFEHKELCAYVFHDPLVIQLCGDDSISDVQNSLKHHSDSYERFNFNINNYHIIKNED